MLPPAPPAPALPVELPVLVLVPDVEVVVPVLLPVDVDV